MSIFNFPNQRIPETKKDEAWHKLHIQGYLYYSTSNEYYLKKQEIQRLYYAYNALLDKKTEKIVKTTITERFGENLGPKYIVYPLCEGKVESVIGHYRKRPLKRKCLVNNPSAVTEKLEKKVDYVSEQILRSVNQDMQPNIGFAPETENAEVPIPDDIQEFFEKDYRTLSEEIGEDVLYQLLIVNKEKEKIYDLLRNYLISGRVFALLDEKEGHPSIFIPHILDCFYETNVHESVQKDTNFFVWDKYMTVNEIYNTWDVSEADKAKIEVYASGHTDENKPKMQGDWFRMEQDGIRIRVVSMMWKSRKKIKFKVITNKTTGKEEYKILPDNYKIRNRDKEDNSVRTIEIDNNRHITMVGPDVVLSFGEEEKQMKRSSDHKKRFLPVVGLIDDVSIGTGEIRSLVKKLIDMQDFASEILYEIRIAMRQNDGNVMVYDLANVPKEWTKLGGDKAIEKVNFYLKRDRIQYINSRDKRSNPYASSSNVSNKGRLDDLMKLLMVIEDLSDTISGISQETQGQGNPYQKATTAQIALNNSTVRMEEYFGIFDTFVEVLLERIILKSKFIYEENQVFSYFGGDSQMKFLQVMPDYFLDDLGVHIADNRKEFKKVQDIEEMAKMAFMNAQTPEMMLELLKIYNADGSSEKEAILRKGVKSLAELREKNNQQLQQAEQATLQQKAKEKDDDNQIKRESHQKDINVAKIYADNKADDTRQKEQGQNVRKLADIEKDLIVANRKDSN